MNAIIKIGFSIALSLATAIDIHPSDTQPKTMTKNTAPQEINLKKKREVSFSSSCYPSSSFDEII